MKFRRTFPSKPKDFVILGTNLLENQNNVKKHSNYARGLMYSLTVGDQTLELYYLGNFHSNGDILILVPMQKVAMLVDLMRPDEPPYRSFGVTPDIDLYLKTHDVLESFDFDVLISGHTHSLATKDDIKTNKKFTESVMENAKNALDSSDPAGICTQTTIKQWEGKLGNLETFMSDHCNAMIEYLKEKS